MFLQMQCFLKTTVICESVDVDLMKIRDIVKQVQSISLLKHMLRIQQKCC